MKNYTLSMMIVILLVMFSAVAAADMLEITNVVVEVDNDKQSADENGGTIKIIPDSKLTLKVEVTNTYDSDVEGSEIENVEIEAILEEIDDGDDFEETSDDYTIRAGRDKSITIEFDIPLRLYTDDSYKLTLVVTGEDENRTDHRDEVEFDVDVDKEKHELRFIRVELSPSSVTCQDSSRLLVHLINTGEEDEEVEFIVDAGTLGYTKTMDLELMEDIDDDDNEYEFSATLDLDDVRVGTYPVLVKAIYRDGRETLEETLDLVVGKCADDEPVVVPTPTPAPTPEPVITPAPAPQPVVQPQPVEVVSEPTSSPYVRPSGVVATPRTSYSQDSWWDDNKWLVIVLVTNLVLIIAAIIVIVTILKKRR